MNGHLAVTLSRVFGQVVVAAAFLAMPHLAPKGLLFGVPVPPGFRSTETGRRALRLYRLWIAIPAAAGLLGMLVIPNPAFSVAAPLSTAVVGMVTFVVLNGRLKPFAIQPSPVRQTELGPTEPLPRFAWLGILPPLMLAGVAVYLHAHWNEIPLRYPVHYNLYGIADRWADRTVRGVYGLLIFGGEFTVVLFGMALAGWYGSRRSDSMRRPMVAVMLAVEGTIALAFGQIPLRATGLIHVPLLEMVFGPLLPLIAAMVYAVHESNQPRDPIDPTPNECWKGGMIYYNPNDAALFVQRRDSMGFTVNFGNRWSWAIYGSLLLVIATGPFVMRLAR